MGMYDLEGEDIPRAPCFTKGTADMTKKARTRGRTVQKNGIGKGPQHAAAALSYKRINDSAFKSIITPPFGHQLAQGNCPAGFIIQQYFNLRAVRVQLHHHLPACPAGRPYPAVRHHGHNLVDLAFPVGDHIGYGVALGTHAKG